MKKSLLLIAVIMSFASLASATGLTGSGTLADPFQISTAADLNLVRDNLGVGIYFKLMNDIDLTTYLASGAGYTAWGSAGWLPIGNSAAQFNGKFNGNGKKITGLTLSRASESQIGLFGRTGANSTIDNLGVEIATGKVTGYQDVGGLVGLNNGTLSQCYVSGPVSSYQYCGGLVGENGANSITNCYASGTVNGYSFLGGLAGYNSSGRFTNCYASGKVTSTGATMSGGLQGYSGLAYYFTNCYWDKTVNSVEYLNNGSGTGKTTVEMKTASTFTGWSGSDWKIDPVINAGYPFLTWQNFGGSSLSVEEAAANAPKEFALEQNYPNPFNPTTAIGYQLSANGFTSLKIYDALGREVATLVNEAKEAGTYSVQFDGAKLSSGIYFAKLTSDRKTQMKKLLLLK